MDDFFALSKDEAPDHIPMMFITVPSAKDPEAAVRHPGTHSPDSSWKVRTMKTHQSIGSVLHREVLHDHPDHGEVRVVRGVEGHPGAQEG